MSRYHLLSLSVLCILLAACGGGFGQSMNDGASSWTANVSGAPHLRTARPAAARVAETDRRIGIAAPAKIKEPGSQDGPAATAPAPAAGFKPAETWRSAPVVADLRRARTRRNAPVVAGFKPAKTNPRLQSPDGHRQPEAVAAKPSAAPPDARNSQLATRNSPTGRPDKMALIAAMEKQDGQAGKDNPGVAKTAASMIFKLAVVLALAYLTLLALKKLSDKPRAIARTQKGLKVIDTVKLSSASNVHLVEVNGKTLLLGCSSGQVSLLQEFEQGETAAIPEPEETPGSDSRFAEYLARYSAQPSPAGRLAGLLRDCAAHLRDRQSRTRRAAGDGDER